MTPKDLLLFIGQVVELEFDDGARITAHLLSVDPDAGQDHVFYEALAVIQPGTRHEWAQANVTGFAASAEEVVAVIPTDGRRHVRAPNSRLFKAP